MTRFKKKEIQWMPRKFPSILIISSSLNLLLFSSFFLSSRLPIKVSKKRKRSDNMAKWIFGVHGEMNILVQYKRMYRVPYAWQPLYLLQNSPFALPSPQGTISSREETARPISPGMPRAFQSSSNTPTSFSNKISPFFTFSLPSRPCL